MKHLVIAIACTGMLDLLRSAIGHAQAVSQSGSYPQSDLAAFHGNSDSLPSAINAVQQTTGGKVVEIRFAQQNGKPGFHTVVAQKGAGAIRSYRATRNESYRAHHTSRLDAQVATKD